MRESRTSFTRSKTTSLYPFFSGHPPLLFSCLLFSSCQGTIDSSLSDEIARITPGDPTQLEFRTVPTTATGGSTFSPHITVAVKDVNGNTVPSYSNPIQLSLGNNPGSGILSTQWTAYPSGGIATFPQVSIDRVGQYSITATSGTLIPATADLSVTLGPLDHFFFKASGISPVMIGSPLAVSLAAQDRGGNPITGFSGKVTLTSTDPAALLPTCTFTPEDQGTKVCSFTLNTAGYRAVVFTSGSASSPLRGIHVISPLASSQGAGTLAPTARIQVGSGPSTNSLGNSIAVDTNGNFYTVGYTTGASGVLGSQIGTHGSADYFISKYNLTGSQTWSRQIGPGSAATASPTRVIIDSSGNLLVTGNTTGTLGTQIGIHGTNDFFIAKFNSNGSKLWTYQIGGGLNTNTYGKGMTTDGSDNIYVTGYTNAPSGSLGPQMGTHGTNDFFIAKLDSTGSPIWTYQIGAGDTSNSYGTSVALDLNGDLYVVGYTDAPSWSLGTQLGTHGTFDLFVAKFNPLGTQVWGNQIGSGATKAAYGSGIAIDSSGNAYVAGDTTGTIGAQLGSAGSKDYFLLKLDSSGNLIWSDQVGGGSSTMTSNTAITLDPTGNPILVGSTLASASGLGTQIGPHGSQDYWVSKFNSNGALQWANQVGSSSINNALGVAMDSSGNSYVTGMTNAASGALGAQIGTSSGGGTNSDHFVNIFGPSGNRI